MIGYAMGETKPSFGYPFNTDVAFASLPFVLMGFNFRKKYLVNKINKKWVMLIFIISVLLLTFTYKYNLPISDYGTRYVAIGYSTYGNPFWF